MIRRLLMPWPSGPGLQLVCDSAGIGATPSWAERDGVSALALFQAGVPLVGAARGHVASMRERAKSRNPEQIERDFLDAIDRLKSGSPRLAEFNAPIASGKVVAISKLDVAKGSRALTWPNRHG